MRFNKSYTVSKSAIIGDNVQIGRNSIIHDNVEIKDDTIICENCIIGEPNAQSYKDDYYINPKTYIGSNSLIRSGSIIYSGSVFGDYFTTGNMVSIRENSIFGIHCIVGTFSDIQG
ncbi:MAG: N-acetyltransferase, partial [Clostridiales bacterium]|nr:N-acetyltransferase [Clostridiales bacterium]